MNISIDIDGVLVDRENYQLAKSKEFAKIYKLNNKIVNPHEYNVDDIFGWTKKDFMSFWGRYLWDYANETPIKDVEKVLHKLQEDGHKIIINTSRWLSEKDNSIGKRMRETVKDWFAKHQLPYDELVFARGDKTSVIKEYKIDCHIEDNPSEAKPIAETIPVIIFDAKYNENYNGENIYHAKSWNEIYEIITNQLKSKIELV